MFFIKKKRLKRYKKWKDDNILYKWYYIYI